ncbi:uncharacterized protein WM277_006559 isoform 2-T2 [Molossus nigricans]
MLVPVTYGSGHLHPALAAFPARTGLDSEGGTKEPGVLPSERINSKPREEAGPRPHRSRQHGDGRCGGTSGSSQHRAFQRQPCIDEYPCDHMVRHDASCASLYNHVIPVCAAVCVQVCVTT